MKENKTIKLEFDKNYPIENYCKDNIFTAPQDGIYVINGKTFKLKKGEKIDEIY